MDIPTAAQWLLAALIILGVLGVSTVLITVYDSAKSAKVFFDRENARHLDRES